MLLWSFALLLVCRPDGEAPRRSECLPRDAETRTREVGDSEDEILRETTDVTNENGDMEHGFRLEERPVYAALLLSGRFDLHVANSKYASMQASLTLRVIGLVSPLVTSRDRVCGHK